MGDYYYTNYTLKNGNYVDAKMHNEFDTGLYESKSVKNYDRMLHRTLSEIFRERRSLSSCQITELLRATDDNRIIQQILEKEPSLSQVFPLNRKIPLLWISVLGYFHNSAELLVRLGADVNERCGMQKTIDIGENTTILHLLIGMYPSSRNERLIGLVINHGADLRALEWNGETVLHSAVVHSRVQVMRLLLEKKSMIDVNAVDNQGWTALLIAAENKEKGDELIPLLIEYGADVTSINKNGHNALYHLSWARGKHVEVARLLIEKGTSVHCRTKYEGQPIHRAALEGNNDLVKLLLDHGADVNAQIEVCQYDFPLSRAAFGGDPSVSLTLLKHGANIDQKTKTTGSTALHTACSRQNVEMIKILLSVGADMFVEDSHGLRPLAFVNYHYEENVRPILRTLAIKRTTHLKPQIELKHERHIKENFSKSWNYYMDCIAEIERMKSTRFIPTCTFFDLLEKCQCEVSELMRNRDFEREFWLYDILEVFPVFAEDLEKAVERAEHYYNSTLQQENMIDDAFQNALPQIVVRKVAGYTLNCEICELKKTVSASRRSAQQAST